MTTQSPLQPTLWRTCRVLANCTRLQIFSLLAKESPLTVTGVAERLNLPLSVTSQSLRALEARGLLTVRRTGRHTMYRLGHAADGNGAELASALKLAVRRGFPVDVLFKLATAFTHPRRIEIFRALQRQAGTLSEIRVATQISRPALLRHLRKLQARGFVECRGWRYSATNPMGALGEALAKLAAKPAKPQSRKSPHFAKCGPPQSSPAIPATWNSRVPDLGRKKPKP